MKSLIEACLFASGDVVQPAEFAKRMGLDLSLVEAAFATLWAEYAENETSGLTIVRIANGFQMTTRPEHADEIGKLLLSPTGKAHLSKPALETLAIVAYRQPATQAEIEAVRGVNVDGVLKTLTDRNLIVVSGRKDVPGRPLLYSTTTEFLHYFGLDTLGDLPPLELVRTAGRERRPGAPHGGDGGRHRMSTIRAIFFDLDDTLCDDAGAWVSCARKAAELGAQLNPAIDSNFLADVFLEISENYWMSLEPIHETRGIFEVRSEQWFQALRAAGNDPSRELAGKMAHDYGARRSTEIELFPDVISTLEELRRRGLCLALITNGLQMTHIEKIAHLGLESLFDHVLIADAIGHFKPDARIFQHALDLCRCEASEALMVGDSVENDVVGAQEAGMRAVWFNPDGRAWPRELPALKVRQVSMISGIVELI